MFLKRGCDELGEWFNDTFPNYTLTIKCKTDKADILKIREYYGILVEGPGGFEKQLNLYLDRGKGLEDSVRGTFVSKMQRAITEAIEPTKDMKLTDLRISVSPE